MTHEEKKIYDADLYVYQGYREVDLAKLITAVMDLPMKQWPAGTCEPKKAKPKPMSSVAPLVLFKGARPEPGDAAAPDKIVDLETGEKKEL
jgi:hypothetical protein